MADNRGGENLGSRFATMSEEERRRFALEQGEGQAEEEIEIDDPRTDPGRTKANLEDRDGAAAQLNERQHDEAVRHQTRARDAKKRAEKRNG